VADNLTTHRENGNETGCGVADSSAKIMRQKNAVCQCFKHASSAARYGCCSMTMGQSVSFA